MIPVMLPSGRLVFCGPQQKKIHLQHCPVCGDGKAMAVVAPVADHITCPGCGLTAGLWRLLDRRPT